jgi:hypothetical protein
MKIDSENPMSANEGSESGNGERSHTSQRTEEKLPATENVEKFTQPELIQESELETEYPEGGLQAWLVVLGAWCALYASLGLMNALGTFQAYISTHQLSAYSEGTIGWIFSVYTFIAWFCGIFIGPLFDMYGPRWLILGGSVCVVGSVMLLGECTGNNIPQKAKRCLTADLLQPIGTSSLSLGSLPALVLLFYLHRRSQQSVTIF